MRKKPKRRLQLGWETGNRALLYEQVFLVLDYRGGEFFHHESSPYQPVLSSHRKGPSITQVRFIAMHHASNVIDVDEEIIASYVYDLIVIDSGALIHSLPGKAVQDKAFDSYFDNIFFANIWHCLGEMSCIDN